MQKSERDGVCYLSFDSVADLANCVESDHRTSLNAMVNDNSPTFCGGTPAQILALARSGWADELDRALEVAEWAVDKVDRDLELPTFTAEHDVAGCEVDVARFLDGTPENMIDYPLRPIVRAGRVITLCVSIGARAGVSGESFIKRGQAATALVLALSRLGYSLEVWADVTASGEAGGAPALQVRTLVKGATDPVDPAGIMYALAHPSMHRGLGFAVRLGLGPKLASRIGYSVETIRDLPEGTIYTPALTGGEDVPDADKQLVQWLKQLEIVPEDD